MLSPRRKEGGGGKGAAAAAASVVSVANSVTTNVEDVDGDIQSGDESHSHATSISNNGSLRYI